LFGWLSASGQAMEIDQLFTWPTLSTRPGSEVCGLDYGFSTFCRCIEHAMLNVNAKIDSFAARIDFTALPFPLSQRIAAAIEED
jgi:hypothetical protein